MQYLEFLRRQTRPGATSPHGTGIADCIVCFICVLQIFQPTLLYPPVVCAVDLPVLVGQIWDQFVTQFLPTHVLQFEFGHTFPSKNVFSSIDDLVGQRYRTSWHPNHITHSYSKLRKNRFVGNFVGVPPKAPKFLRGLVIHMFCLTNFLRGI